MSEYTKAALAADGVGPPQATGHHAARENLTTQQMRTIGQRRTDAEEKLARHLEEAGHTAAIEHPAADRPGDL